MTPVIQSKTVLTSAITLCLVACGGSESPSSTPIRLTGPAALASVASDAVAADGTALAAATLDNFPATINQDFATRFPAVVADDRSRTINYSGGSVSSESWTIEGESADESIEVEARYSTEGNFLSSESRMEITELPAALAATLDQQFPGAEIDEIEQTTDSNGNPSYEVEIELDSGEIEVSLDASGNILSTSMEISRAQVPSAVLTAIDQDINGFDESEFDTITSNDGSTIFEAEFETDTESVTAIYTQTGELISMTFESESESESESD